MSCFIDPSLSNYCKTKNHEVSVYGKVIALSHTFRTLNGLVFFIELLSGQKLVHIVVNISSHLLWLSLIEYGSTYNITCLRQNVLWQQTHNVEVLVVTTKSELLKQRRSLSLEVVNDECKDKRFISYQGVVTEVTNDQLGIYQLDGEVTLLVPYLIGLVKEFSEENVQFFKIGDQVMVINAHKLKGTCDNTTLLCCGRSFVTNLSATHIHNTSDDKRGFSDNSIIHCIHKYNLGVEFFYWLRNIEEILISSTPSEVNTETIVRREYNGRKGALTQFIAKLSDFKAIKPVKRSILEEFLLREHSCCVLNEFQQPFNPTLLEHISSQHHINDINNVLWKYHVIKKKEHNWVIFGILKLTEEGYVKLVTKVNSILVIFLEGKHNIYNKLDSLVAIINFDWVEECFSIFGQENEDLTKKYIIARSANILNLVPSGISKIISGSSYEIKIFSKSGLYFNHDATDSFFICNASVTFLDAFMSRKENWPTLLCFKGALAKLYPCISDKAGIKGKVLNRDSGHITFRKKRSFAWLRSTYDYFGTTECVDVPENYKIENIETYNSSSNSYSILDILDNKCDGQEAITVEGLVTKRLLISPLFQSEKVNLSTTLLNQQIGIPGSKILRFYLQDVHHSHAIICIYVNSRTDKCYLRQYPLGVIPGVKLRITWLKKNISKQCNTYLLTTNFTTIDVISDISPQILMASHSEYTVRRKYLSQIFSLKHNSIVTLLATISSIIVINLKKICSFCESDFRNGRCDYIGCHAVEQGILTGSAKFVIDDGTGVAFVVTKDFEHVKKLCNLNSQQWETFAALIGDEPVSLHSKYKFTELHETMNNLNLLLNTSQILRPVLLTCRTFYQSTVFSPNLFLLNIKPVKYNSDWKRIFK